jgi:hypothetical protein
MIDDGRDSDFLISALYLRMETARERERFSLIYGWMQILESLKSRKHARCQYNPVGDVWFYFGNSILVVHPLTCCHFRHYWACLLIHIVLFRFEHVMSLFILEQARV